jgi:hypothetical protein
VRIDVDPRRRFAKHLLFHCDELSSMSERVKPPIALEAFGSRTNLFIVFESQQKE